MNEWVDEKRQMDVSMGGVGGWMNKGSGRWMNGGWQDKWIDEGMNEWMDE